MHTGVNVRSIVKVAPGCEVLADRLLSHILITDDAETAMHQSIANHITDIFLLVVMELFVAMTELLLPEMLKKKKPVFCKEDNRLRN